MARIVAYDLSLRSTGIAHLHSGILTLRTVKTNRKTVDLQEAVRVQSAEAVSILNLGTPDVVIIESGAMGAIRGKGYEELAALRWLILDHVRHYFGLEAVQISPSHLKKVITGNGRASKTEVQAVVNQIAEQKYWPVPANDDEADAAALILTYLADQEQPVLL